MVARVPGNPNANIMLTRKKSLAAMMDLSSGGEMPQIVTKFHRNSFFFLRHREKFYSVAPDAPLIGVLGIKEDIQR